MSWLLLVVAAWPGKRAPEPAPAPTPDACEAGTVEGFRIHTGFATDPDPDDAISGARADARKQAIEGLCAGKSESRCTAIRRHLEPWRTPHHDPDTGRACAHVGVNRSWIDDDRGDQQALVRDLHALAEAISAVADDRPVALSPVLWKRSGCVAGEAADAVHAELRNALGTVGGVTLLPEARTDAIEVRLSLEPGAGGVALTGEADVPGVAAASALPGATFPDDLFALGDARGDCRFDDALGLVDGRRAGPGGLTVRLTLGTAERRLCEGDRVEPAVSVSRPATVKVYSVARSGVGLLIWPMAGQNGEVDGSASLGPLDLTLSPEGGDEKLVAVAVPRGAPYTGQPDWNGLCAMPGTFDAGSMPTDSAASAATLTVLPWDADTCLARDVASRGAVTLPVLPTCPETWSP